MEFKKGTFHGDWNSGYQREKGSQKDYKNHVDYPRCFVLLGNLEGFFARYCSKGKNPFSELRLFR